VYCARRLRSLYKSLRFLHGRGRYQKRKLDVAMVTDARCARWLAVEGRRVLPRRRDAVQQ
jgi:hypothetical protein